MQFSTKVTQLALDLPSLFKETTLSLPQSLYRYGTMYMYVSWVTGQLRENLLPCSIKLSLVYASGVFMQS